MPGVRRLRDPRHRPAHARDARGQAREHRVRLGHRLLEPGLAKIIHNFKHVLVAELNTGQLRQVLRATFLVDCVGLNKIQGLPFKVREVSEAIEQLLGTPAKPSTDIPAQPLASA